MLVVKSSQISLDIYLLLRFTFLVPGRSSQAAFPRYHHVQEHRTQRQLILHETEALTVDLSRLRRGVKQAAPEIERRKGSWWSMVIIPRDTILYH